MEKDISLVVSIGDCNGIGIEVLAGALRVLKQGKQKIPFSLFLAANAHVLDSYTAKIGAPYTRSGNTGTIEAVPYTLLPCSCQPSVELGTSTASAGALAVEALEKAVAEVVQGRVDAVVTLPVSKAAMQSAGYAFLGQTEYVAQQCAVANPMMILCTHSIRVGLVSIHIPVAKVPAAITTAHVCERICTFQHSLRRDFGIAEPRIAVLGLNPHAGEGGAIGTEEIESLIPAIAQSSRDGCRAEGPFPADGFFAHGMYREYDGILAMYHDQGLIPLKLLANGGGVNFTAGVPIVRTSPDHGTAFSIAGKGIADPSSTVEALRLAMDIVIARRRYQ